MSEEERMRRLTEGLAGAHQAMYRLSASFKTFVDTLVPVLVAMVDLAAEQAKQEKALRDAMVEAAKRGLDRDGLVP